MKIKKTFFLKGALYVIGAVVLAVCIMLIVQIVKENMGGPDYPMLMGIVVMMELSAIPFFIGLFQAHRLLRYIDKGVSFSPLSVKALRNITYCAVTVAALYVAGFPHLYFLAQGEDAPGVLLMGWIIVFASVVIAVFAGVLQALVRSAIELQSENDLTV